MNLLAILDQSFTQEPLFRGVSWDLLFSVFSYLVFPEKCLFYFDVSFQLKAPFLIKSFTWVYENDLGE